MAESHTGPALDAGQAMPILEATPATLRSLLAPLPQAWLDFREEPGAWSPRMVLVHLIHNERTNWMPRARIILSAEGERRFPPFRQMPDPGEIDDRYVGTMLARFESLRRKNLGALHGLALKPDDYGRTAEHPVLGTVTLGQLLAAWVVHDLNHVHQIVKSVAKVQAEAVGPWRGNLGILGL